MWGTHPDLVYWKFWGPAVCVLTSPLGNSHQTKFKKQFQPLIHKLEALPDSHASLVY